MIPTLYRGLGSLTARGPIVNFAKQTFQNNVRYIQSATIKAAAATTTTIPTTHTSTTSSSLSETSSASEVNNAIRKLREQLRYYAVAEISGRPYLITKNDQVIVNRLKDVKVGDVIQLDKVREIGSKDYNLKGAPYLPEKLYNIHATVIEHTKSRMIHIVKKKRRKGYKRTIDHKQTHTVLRISEVEVSEPVNK